ncbi:DUF2515 family protein [Calidifontibacillus oryziterrae]|uniref:DUF2515 family protein n=1 Tax=Calidifontibacillus oryziterrae TaxID=1191699 RepID=UPI001E48F622|nr:DUF2515 family protein [Calidifontibacillus oryziterrae]
MIDLDSQLGSYENKIVAYIRDTTIKGNIDNITRTKLYQQFFFRNPEIEWAFLASMVSRNAGWNMTDLRGVWFPKMINQSLRDQIFFTYERANWLIFLDAFPQLLLYEICKRERTNHFYLLQYFRVSLFMQNEWQRFWEQKDRKRLLTALIVNEQNVIQKPVIEHWYYKRKVFHSLPFLFQDWMHYSCVLFPTVDGELYGFSVHDFSDLNERIELGKKLAWLLFHHHYFSQFKKFAQWTEHTGSRYDYEQYYLTKKQKGTPLLREVYPIVEHERHVFHDWYRKNKSVERWFSTIKPPKKYHITKWFQKKQKHLHACIYLKSEIFDRLLTSRTPPV